MTSQDGLPEQEDGSTTTSSYFRRRSLYEELGLSMDLFVDGGANAEPGPAGDPYRYQSGAGHPAGHPNQAGTATRADDTESFLASLRSEEDADGGSGYLPAQGEPGSYGQDGYDVTDSYHSTEYTSRTYRGGLDAPTGSDSFGSYLDLGSSTERSSLLDRDPAPPTRPTSAQLTAEHVLRQRAEQPGRGWRKAVFQATGGLVNLGPAPEEIRERELVNRARTPLRGCHRLAVISLKGGVGKTTTTAALGSMFATLRGDRVIAMDANPDRGTLGEKIPRESTRTVRDMVNNAARMTRYADVREYTSQAPSRLEVLASDVDPFVSMAFSEADYRISVGILESFYNLILTDCGTGLLHSAMVGVLGLADSLIVVSSASLDGARSASATLDWLEHHGYDDLVRRCVAVISTVHPGGGNVDVGKLEDHFASRCRAVARIPFDPHLEEGAIIDLDELQPATYEAYLKLAADVGDGFAIPPRL
ncbi:MAG: MinD/ParA family protein [Sporichthyaceae bacterium]|nr:MinD/ParA family protein [Sporichthyaceae bacterium]